ncbi:MAG: RNA polymerase sigma factor [Actinomycetota bacterium]
MTTGSEIEDLLRELAPHVLGVLVRRHGQFDACEDAVQEALLAAGQRWIEGSVPDDPRAWLVTVASRRLVDEWRSESARRRREEITAAMEVPAPDALTDGDDTLTLLFLCCHPALSVPSQLALTLRAVGGLTTAEIAKAFLVPEATMAQRISRAKQRIRDTGARFDLPPEQDRAERLRVVLHVLYLVFNEGYAATAGPGVTRADLTTEAIRLTRLLHRLMPADGEVAGLLALMLLTDARRAARTDEEGALVPLAEQRRELWDAAQIEDGLALVTETLGTTSLGPYQLQAAIAAVHDEAATAEATDWPQILALYEVLERVSPGPVVTLNRAVAVAMVHGPRAGLALLGTIEADDRMTQTHRLDAVRAHLLELAGDVDTARDAYRRAATRTASIPERRYLALQAARLGSVGRPDTST